MQSAHFPFPNEFSVKEEIFEEFLNLNPSFDVDEGIHPSLIESFPELLKQEPDSVTNTPHKGKPATKLTTNLTKLKGMNSNHSHLEHPEEEDEEDSDDDDESDDEDEDDEDDEDEDDDDDAMSDAFDSHLSSSPGHNVPGSQSMLPLNPHQQRVPSVNLNSQPTHSSFSSNPASQTEAHASLSSQPFSSSSPAIPQANVTPTKTQTRSSSAKPIGRSSASKKSPTPEANPDGLLSKLFHLKTKDFNREVRSLSLSEKEVIELKAQRRRLKNARAAQKRRSKLSDDLKTLKKQVTELNKQVDDLTTKLRKSEAEVARLRAKH